MSDFASSDLLLSGGKNESERRRSPAVHRTASPRLAHVEIRNLRKEIETTRLDLADRIHIKECNRRMEEQSARLCALEKDERNHLMAFHTNNPTITREL